MLFLDLLNIKLNVTSMLKFSSLDSFPAPAGEQVHFTGTVNLLEMGRDYKTNTCFSNFLCMSSFQYGVIREKLRIKVDRMEIYQEFNIKSSSLLQRTNCTNRCLAEIHIHIWVFALSSSPMRANSIKDTLCCIE